jgi:hypothetical protein
MAKGNKEFLEEVNDILSEKSESDIRKMLMGMSVGETKKIVGISVKRNSESKWSAKMLAMGTTSSGRHGSRPEPLDDVVSRLTMHSYKKENRELSELAGGVQREDPPRMVKSWKKRTVDRIKDDEEKIASVLMNDLDRKPKSVRLVRNRKEEEDTDVYFDLKVNGKIIGGVSAGYPHDDWSFGPKGSMKAYGRLDKPYEAILKAATKILGYNTRSRGYDESLEESKKKWTVDEVRYSGRSDVLLVGRNNLKNGEPFFWHMGLKYLDADDFDFSHAKFDKKLNKYFVDKIKEMMKEDVDVFFEEPEDSEDDYVIRDEAKGGGTSESIKALRDTDYRDSSAYFKMVQLLKGIASVAEDDKMADKFLSAVSDALTSAARKVLPGSGDGEDDPKIESKTADISWMKNKLDSVRKSFSHVKGKYFVVDGTYGNFYAYDPNGKHDDLKVQGGMLKVAQAFYRKHPEYKFYGFARPNQKSIDKDRIFSTDDLEESRRTLGDELLEFAKRPVVGIGTGSGHFVPKGPKRYVIRWARTNDYITDKYLEKRTTKDPSKAMIFKTLPQDLGGDSDEETYELTKDETGYEDMAGQIALHVQTVYGGGKIRESNDSTVTQLEKELRDVQKKLAKIQKMKDDVKDDWPKLKRGMKLQKWAQVLIGEDVDIDELQEAIPIGKTLEVGNLRIHRFRSSIRVTDITNAGKRGKKVDEFALYDLDYVKDKKALKAIEDFASYVHRAKSYKQARQMAKEVADEHSSVLMAPKFSEEQHRGVDVAPANFEKIHITTPNIEVDVNHDSFLIKDLRDPLNEPRTMEHPSAQRSSVQKMRTFVGKNREEIKRMTYGDLLKAMGREGIRFHSWCAVD